MAVPVAEASAQGVAGSYLAARHATYQSDFRALADYATRALVHDPANPALLESAVTAFVSLGSLDRAVPFARRMQAQGIDSQLAHIVLAADQAARGDFSALLADIEAGRSVGPLVDGLMAAWALIGEGRMSDALAAFDAVTAQPGLAGFGLYHKALALAAAGDFEGADAIFADGAAPMQRARRGAVAYAQILSQLGRNEAALEVLGRAYPDPADPAVAALRRTLQSGARAPFTTLARAQDGLAEVFFSVANALEGEASDGYTLIYARTAEALNPKHVDATLLSADLLEAMGRYDLATETYDLVPRDHPAFHAAEMGRAASLHAGGQSEEAVAVLQALSETHADLPVVHVALGDMLRRLERYEGATRAYDRAITLYRDPEPGQWFLYFARGITHEREDNWPLAEADFRMALELNPGQPQVLNYLGYSLVEMRERLDEALAMIEEAVAARPDSGHIVDSLGWVLYRLGRPEEAVEHMERAAELLPVDPIINDHLGDVYWAVGRRTEARFQWQRALSFDPEPEEATRIRRKLEIGLDAVYREENASPVDLAGDGG
jgi:tetratricopeptide (TPR) repeat protein